MEKRRWDSRSAGRTRNWSCSSAPVWHFGYFLVRGFCFWERPAPVAVRPRDLARTLYSPAATETDSYQIKTKTAHCVVTQSLPLWPGSWGIADWAWWFCIRWCLRPGRGAGRAATRRWTGRRSSRPGRPRELWPGSAGEKRWPRKEPQVRRIHREKWSDPGKKKTAEELVTEQEVKLLWSSLWNIPLCEQCIQTLGYVGTTWKKWGETVCLTFRVTEPDSPGVVWGTFWFQAPRLSWAAPCRRRSTRLWLKRYGSLPWIKHAVHKETTPGYYNRAERKCVVSCTDDSN